MYLLIYQRKSIGIGFTSSLRQHRPCRPPPRSTVKVFRKNFHFPVKIIANLLAQFKKMSYLCGGFKR